jgi:hypothetical protein
MESTNHSIRNPRNTPPGLQSSQTGRLLKLPSVTPSGVLPGRRHHQNPSRPARIPPRLTTLGFLDFGMLTLSKLKWQDNSLVGTTFFGEFGAEIHGTHTQSSPERPDLSVQEYKICLRVESLLAHSPVAGPSIAARPVVTALLNRTVPQPLPERSTRAEPTVRGQVPGGVSQVTPTDDWGGQGFRSLVGTPSPLVSKSRNRRDVRSPSPLVSSPVEIPRLRPTAVPEGQSSRRQSFRAGSRFSSSFRSRFSVFGSSPVCW